jgi:hypothetical protein
MVTGTMRQDRIVASLSAAENNSFSKQMLFMVCDPNKVSTDPIKAETVPNCFFGQKKRSTRLKLENFPVFQENQQFKILTTRMDCR